MGRGNSKFYGFHQTLSGLPHVEGLASRTPPAAYGYIEANYLLREWRGNASVVCAQSNLGEFTGALDQLIDDGFTYVVVHRSRVAHDTIQGSYIDITPAYEDDYVRIYLVDTFRKSCP